MVTTNTGITTIRVTTIRGITDMGSTTVHITHTPHTGGTTVHTTGGTTVHIIDPGDPEGTTVHIMDPGIPVGTTVHTMDPGIPGDPTVHPPDPGDPTVHTMNPGDPGESAEALDALHPLLPTREFAPPVGVICPPTRTESPQDAAKRHPMVEEGEAVEGVMVYDNG